MTRVLILGGYGTFGSLVARELASPEISVTIAGRDEKRAKQFASSLGPSHRGLAVDVNDPAEVSNAMGGHRVVVHCAGPFFQLNASVLDACLRHKCHYVDIGDDRKYVANLRLRHNDFVAAGVCALFGCSSLPAISGALGTHLVNVGGEKPASARITLLVGNNNPKGIAAISSMLRTLGQPIQAPQGTLIGFRHSEVVIFPEPFGQRRNYPAESPDYDLFPAMWGVSSVRVGFCFELALSNWLMSLLARLPFRYGPRTARLLAAASGPFRVLGTSGGAIMTELFFPRQGRRSAALVGRSEGQRMAALPCAIAAKTLLDPDTPPGATTIDQLLGAERFLQEITKVGYELRVS